MKTSLLSTSKDIRLEPQPSATISNFNDLVIFIFVSWCRVMRVAAWCKKVIGYFSAVEGWEYNPFLISQKSIENWLKQEK